MSRSTMIRKPASSLAWTVAGTRATSRGSHAVAAKIRSRTKGAFLGTSVLLRTVAHRVAELLALFCRSGLQFRTHQISHDWDPVRDPHPLRSIPLLEHDRTRAFVVLAGGLQLVSEALHAELLEPRVGHVQMLEAPAHLFPREGFVAVSGHGRAECFHLEHRDGQSAIVKNLAYRLALPGALAPVVHVLEDFFVHLETCARRVKSGTEVSLGREARRPHVRVTG